jgi:GMP reductase
MSIEREYNYEDVYLKPQRCIVKSRSECDISVRLGTKVFSNPVIAANMKSVVDYGTCEFLASMGMFYIMHRFDLNLHEHIDFIEDMNHRYFSSISVGIGDSDKELLTELKANSIKVDYITIDVAHAYSDRVADMIQTIRKTIPTAYIIAGNVASAEAVSFLESSGADATKIFIAPGAACTTKVETGFTRGTVSCLLECAKVARNPIIADGGVREAGHIAKAMACGATMVMVGSYMCGFDENPGDIVLIDGKKKYVYYGSASFNNKQSKHHVEGRELLLDYKGSMEEHIKHIECSLRSAVSYSGKNNLYDMYGTPLFTIR